MIVSAAIAVKDKPHPKQIKKGDIVAIKPAGHQWGSEEVKRYLIVEISYPEDIPFERLKQIIQQPQMDWDGDFNEPIPPKTQLLKKRRFKVDIGVLESESAKQVVSIDWEKAEDEKLPYQPLSAQSFSPGAQSKIFNFDGLVDDKKTESKASLTTIQDMRAIK